MPYKRTVGCVYLAKNLINGKYYVGKSIRSLRHRISDHRNRVKNGSIKCFHSALRKYGFENFEWLILYESLENSQLCDMEQVYIKKFNSKIPNGYNLTDGGEGTVGYKCSAEQCMKNSINKKGNKNNLGKKHDKEALEKMSFSKLGNKYKLGYKTSKETREKISLYRKGVKTGPMKEHVKEKISRTKTGVKRAPFSAGWKKNISNGLLGNKYRAGKKASKETREKISTAQKGNSYALGNRFTHRGDKGKDVPCCLITGGT